MAHQDHEEGMDVYVYICPTPGCHNYFGASGGHNLASQFSGPKIENKHAHKESTGSPYRQCRAECPDCRQNYDKRVMRTLVRFGTVVPKELSEAPALPAA